MSVVKLTDQFLKTAKPIAREVTTRYFDSKWTGLCARVGAKAVTFYAQAGGRMHKIGHWPKWTVDEARKECQAIQVKVDRGEDPTGARQNLPTLAEAFEDFAKVRLAKRRPKTAREYRRQLQIYLFPKWGKRQVNQLTRADVVRLHAELTRAGKPTRANRVVATISSLYGWLQRDAGLDVANPAARIERNQEHSREHFLDAQQVAGLRAALEDYAQKLGGRSRGNDIAADCILFCIATGCRSGEARTATWDQFDEALTVWSKPASTTKQRKKHRSPIGPAAQAVLLRRRGLRRTGETSVFPS